MLPFLDQNRRRKQQLVLSAALLCATATQANTTSDTAQPVCLYISSNHHGFSWSDRVEQSLRDGIGQGCRIVQYDMDTKRRKTDADIRAAAAAAAALIEQTNPDVVITSDDNAARHVIAPHLVNTDTPVVFSGVNWTVEEYQLPADNVTGIVEVAPVGPMIEQAVASVPSATTAAYIGSMTLTERKDFERIEKASTESGVVLLGMFVETFTDWQTAFDVAQNHDFVIIGSHSGIEDWDFDAAETYALANTQKLSVTNLDWMMPVAALGYTKLPEEQGEWAATSTMAILSGARPSDIPIVTSRKWDTWINQSLIDAVGVKLPETLTRRAKRYD